MIDEQIKKQIDGMSYKSMLDLWRNALDSSPFFHDEVGDYYMKIMAQKRSDVGCEGHVEASKTIG